VRWRELFDFVAAMVGGAAPQTRGKLGFPGFCLGWETGIMWDDTPVRWRGLFAFFSPVVGVPPPQAGGRLGFPGFRMSNAKARRMLGWAPFYSDYRAGLIR
jgi:nucleoside-diphosphate-sugar epimerase